MVSFNALLALVPAIVWTTQAATTNQCLQDINGIYAGVRELIPQIQSYDGNIIAAGLQSVTLSKILFALAALDQHTDELPIPITEADTNAIVQLVNSTLTINNPIAIDAIIAKKQVYVDQHFDFIILAALRALAEGHSRATANILERISQDAAARALPVTETITLALQKGIVAFQTKSKN